MYQLKQLPEDFIVKEISSVQLKDKGSYLYFLMKKKNRNTLDVVKEIAKQLNLKEKQVGFAGSKDKQAVTEQVCSVKNISKEKLSGLRIDNVELKFLGYNDQPICLGDLAGNQFEITVRNLDSIKIKIIDFVENYFDEQRFSRNNAEIGRYLVKKKFKEAVKLIDAPKVQQQLQKNPNDSIGALKLLPLRLLKLYVNAYQSYLWNETLAEYLKNKTGAKEVKYSLGSLFFIKKKIKNFDLPLIGFDELKTKAQIKKIINKIMQKEGLTHQDFIIKPIPELSLEGEERKAFVKIKDLEIKPAEPDELNKNKPKIKVKFTLPKGSYATMVIRKLFLD